MRQHSINVATSKVSSVGLSFQGQDEDLKSEVALAEAVELADEVDRTYTKKFSKTVRYGNKSQVDPSEAAEFVRRHLGISEKTRTAGNRIPEMSANGAK